jgi:hypothetical protein
MSNALQNMIMQHADMRMFVQYYLRQQVTADTTAIVCGLDLQYKLMRAVCKMSRCINPDRPQELTEEKSLSVNKDSCIRQVLAHREELKCCFKNEATKQPIYQLLGQEIFKKRQQKISALLK